MCWKILKCSIELRGSAVAGTLSFSNFTHLWTQYFFTFCYFYADNICPVWNDDKYYSWISKWSKRKRGRKLTQKRKWGWGVETWKQTSAVYVSKHESSNCCWWVNITKMHIDCHVFSKRQLVSFGHKYTQFLSFNKVLKRWLEFWLKLSSFRNESISFNCSSWFCFVFPWHTNMQNTSNPL